MLNKQLLSALMLNGNDVKNAQGENLGHVRDIMLDTVNNRIGYYVLSFGGWLEVGDKLFAIPPEAMKVNMEDKSFILNVDKENLKNAEGFDKDNWPDMADSTFRSNLYSHYGLTDRLVA
jgi:uncharacterized protein YrrD